MKYHIKPSDKISIYSCLFIMTLSSLMPLKVFAIDTGFYSANDILFYNPDDTGCNSSGDSSGGSVKLTKSEKLKLIFQTLIDGGMNAVQAAAVMGNMQAESGFNNDSHETGGGGYGLVQWTGGRRTNLEKYAAKKGVPASDIAMQVEFLLKEYNNGDYRGINGSEFKNATNIVKATTAWMTQYESPAVATAHLPRRIKAAKEVYALYKDLAPAITESSSDTTGNCGGAVAGDVVSTALNFALDKPIPPDANPLKNQPSDAKPAYVAAIDKYNKGASVADCGMFVGTVMIASGADTNYPKNSTLTQLNYVNSKTDKYKIINSPKRTDLMPGDILIVHNDSTGSHHTMIYTGETPNPAVDASLNERVPSVRNDGSLKWMIDQSGVIVARLIK